MTMTKECFGRCANMAIRYRSQMNKHFLYVDEEKFRECDTCVLFTKCMFLRHNELIRNLIRLIDHEGRDPRPRIG